jgi:hypothetical protein
MKNRASLILIVLFLGGLALLAVLERKGRDTGEADRERLLSGFFDAPGVEVRAVEISVVGSKPLRFERRGDDWQLVQPIDALADRSMLNGLIETLRALAPRRDAGDVPGSPRDYRLDPAERTITLIAAGERRTSLKVKIGEFRRDFVYIQVNDDPTIEVAGSNGLKDLPDDAASWRSRVLFPMPSHEVEKVAFEADGRKFALEHGVGTWKIVKPFRAPAEDPKVEGLVDTLLGLRVAVENGLVADDVGDLKRFGLDHPRLRIEVTTGRKNPIARTLNVGNDITGRPGFVYATIDGQDDVVAVDRSAVPPLASLPLSLRNTEVADVDFDNATGLRIKSGMHEYMLTREGKDWTQTSPVNGKGDYRLLLDYLAHLGGLHALAIVPEGEAIGTGLDHPTAIIQVWHGLPRKESPDVTLRLGRFDPETQVIYAQVEGEPNVLSLPATARSLILEGRLALVDRTIQQIPPGSIRRITIEHDGKTVTLAASSESQGDEHWSMTEPVKARVDTLAVSALDAVLSRLRADDLRPDATPAVSGLSQPWLRADWVLEDRSRGSLSVGSPVSEGHGERFAASSTADGPFTLSESIVAILSAEMHERTILRIPENTINTITVRSAGSVRRWRREAKVFQQSDWVAEPGTEPSEAVGPFAQALADLQTSRYLQYQGPFDVRYGLSDDPLIIEVQESSGARPARLRIGSIADNGRFAATTSEGEAGAVFLLPESLIRPLLPDRKLPAEVFQRD